MTDLVRKQIRFMTFISFLLDEFHAVNITAGDFMRSPEEAKRLAALGLGIESSAHCLRLAADLLIRKQNGAPSKDRADYEPLGVYWKSLPTLYPRGIPLITCWGGDFKRDDFYHFSIEHNGIK